MEINCFETKGIQQQCQTRECVVADMDEGEIQAKDGVAGNTQLVSMAACHVHRRFLGMA